METEYCKWGLRTNFFVGMVCESQCDDDKHHVLIRSNGSASLSVFPSSSSVVLSSVSLSVLHLNSIQSSAALAVRGRLRDAQREKEKQMQLIQRAVWVSVCDLQVSTPVFLKSLQADGDCALLQGISTKFWIWIYVYRMDGQGPTIQHLQLYTGKHVHTIMVIYRL